MVMGRRRHIARDKSESGYSLDRKEVGKTDVVENSNSVESSKIEKTYVIPTHTHTHTHTHI